MGGALAFDHVVGRRVRSSAEHRRRPLDGERRLQRGDATVLDAHLERERRGAPVATDGDRLLHPHRQVARGRAGDPVADKADPGAPAAGAGGLDRERAIDDVTELVDVRTREGARRRAEREEVDEARAALVAVVVELLGEAGLLRGHDLVDRRDPVRGRQDAAVLGKAALVGDERLVGGLGAPPQHGRQRVAHCADVPAPDPGALGRLHRHDLAVGGEDDLGRPVEVHVLLAHAVDGGAGGPGGGVGRVLGGDEVLVCGEPHVADVDPAEEPVPVAVVGLALVEVVERRGAGRAIRHRGHLLGGPEHLLVEVVDLAVLDLEVAPEPAAQVAVRRGGVRLRPVDQVGEDAALGGRQGPLAHLGVGRGRQVDPPDGPVRGEPVGRGHRRQPGSVRLERLEEAVDPAGGTPAVLPGRGPGAELLAVVAHHADPLPGLCRVLAQVGDHVIDLAERDQVAEALLRAEDRQHAALVVRRVRPPVAIFGDRRRSEVVVVDDRPAVAGGDERRRHVRLPDPLGEPGTARPAAGDALHRVGHLLELADPVALGERREHRLVVAAAEQLHLAAVDEAAESLQEVRPLGAHPVEERPGVVEGEPHPGMALQRLDQRQVGVLEDIRDDPSEVADGLVVVNREGEGDARGHGSSVGRGGAVRCRSGDTGARPQPASVTTGRFAATGAGSIPPAGR